MITIEFGAVYKIENLVNHKVYIGQSSNFNRRKSHHFYNLKQGIHHNRFLQEDYNIYGLDNFIISILEKQENKEKRIERETYWINYYGGMNSETTYNCIDNINICEKQRNAIVKSNQTRVLKESTLKKYSENNKGIKNPYYNKRKYDDEFIENLRHLYQNGKTYAELERLFNINQRLIKRLILYGKTTNLKVGEYKRNKRTERRRLHD